MATTNRRLTNVANEFASMLDSIEPAQRYAIEARDNNADGSSGDAARAIRRVKAVLDGWQMIELQPVDDSQTQQPMPVIRLAIDTPSRWAGNGFGTDPATYKVYVGKTTDYPLGNVWRFGIGGWRFVPYGETAQRISHSKLADLRTAIQDAVNAGTFGTF